ncbi:hypothetical protein ACFW4X_28855, partial [Streptomyces smyrnaeus]
PRLPPPPPRAPGAARGGGGAPAPPPRAAPPPPPASAAATPRIAPATAYALGVLHADQRHEVEAARFAFGHHWREGGPL